MPVTISIAFYESVIAAKLHKPNIFFETFHNNGTGFVVAVSHCNFKQRLVIVFYAIALKL